MSQGGVRMPRDQQLIQAAVPPPELAAGALLKSNGNQLSEISLTRRHLGANRTRRFQEINSAPFIDSDPGYMSRKFESLERINSIRETNGNFDSCNSCKGLGTNRLQLMQLMHTHHATHATHAIHVYGWFTAVYVHELHEPKFPSFHASN